MVRNNYEATLNVGDRIPISSVSFNPITGADTGTVSQVQYLDTGTILKVRPRVTKDGTVFLDIVQEVSAPKGVPDVNGNVTISTNRLKTNAIVQSGDTVLLAGLITDGTERGSRGFPDSAEFQSSAACSAARPRCQAQRNHHPDHAEPVRNPQEARNLTTNTTGASGRWNRCIASRSSPDRSGAMTRGSGA